MLRIRPNLHARLSNHMHKGGDCRMGRPNTWISA